MVEPDPQEDDGRELEDAAEVDGLRELSLLDETSLAAVAIGERTGEVPEQMTRMSEDLWERATRRIRLLGILLLGFCVLVGLAVIVLKLLRVIFGSISDSYQMLENLERT